MQAKAKPSLNMGLIMPAFSFFVGDISKDNFRQDSNQLGYGPRCTRLYKAGSGYCRLIVEVYYVDAMPNVFNIVGRHVGHTFQEPIDQ